MIHQHVIVDIVVIIILPILINIIYLFHETNAFYERPGVSAKEIIEDRGYFAQEHYITTPDGYRLRLTRGNNPLINSGQTGLTNRDPILFSHGILEDSAVFLINSLDVKEPHDFSAMNVSDPNVAVSLANEPSARSAAFLAMDLGHEIWLLNRRGFPGSQEKIGNKWSVKPRPRRRRRKRESSDEKDNNNSTESGVDDVNKQDEKQDEHHEHEESEDHHNDNHDDSGHDDKDHDDDHDDDDDDEVGASKSWIDPLLALPGALVNYGRLGENIRFSFNRDFWSFTFDQQAKYDFPMAVDYILKATNRSKVASITHSAAGNILLMSMSSIPDLSEKLSSNVFWAQGFRLGFQDSFTRLTVARPFFENYGGSLPPASMTSKLQGILGAICNIPLAPRTLCPFFAEFIAGQAGGREPIKPQFLSTLFYPTSAGEIAQNLQSLARGNIMHRYDYGKHKNRQLYGGQDEPPIYDLAKIKPNSTGLSFFTSKTDRIVSHQDVEQTLNLLPESMARKFHLIDTLFSHQGYFFHDDNARLAIIPTLIDIQQGRQDNTGRR